MGAGNRESPRPSAIAAGAPPVTSDGKPQNLYIGAEYCPFCAAERWPMVVASCDRDVLRPRSVDVVVDRRLPEHPTLTFHGSTYTSDAIAFDGVETNTNQLAASVD